MHSKFTENKLKNKVFLTSWHESKRHEHPDQKYQRANSS